MKPYEFIKEVKESNICPKNFDKIYEEFKNYQKDALLTLYEFHRVCEKNKINYALSCGSLLGIIRDGGQIPWDYDIDVMISYSEKMKLIDALKKDLNEDYYFYCIETNPECRHMMLRVAPKGYKSESLHVDVFYYIGAPTDEKNREKFAKKIIKLSYMRFYKKVVIKEECIGNIKKRIKYIIKKFQYSLINMDKVMNEYYELCEKYKLENSKINICADIWALEDQYDRIDLWNTKIVNDDQNHELRIPENYEKILTKKYGDYNKLPPLKNRIREMMVFYKKIKNQNINSEKFLGENE